MSVKNYKKIIKGLYADNLYKNSFYLMLSTIVNGLLGFVFLMIATHIYSSQAVGIYSALFSVMSLIVLFSMSGGFYNTIMMFIPTISESERSDLIYSSFMIHIFIVAIISLIFVFFVDIFSSKLIFLKDLFYGFIFVLFTIFLAVFGLFNSVFMAFRKTQYVLIKDVATNVGKIFLLLFFVPFLYMGIFYSVGIGTIVGIIICFFFSYKTKLIKKFKLNINFNILIKNWKYIFRNYFIVLSSYLPSLFFPILVLEILSAETNAYFYITWTIFSLITMLGMSITGSLFVEGSYREDKIKKNTTKGLKALLVIATISILGVFLFGKFIFSLFGEEYLNSLDLLYVFMASIYLFLINKLYLIILLLKMRINGALIFNFLISGSTIIFGTLLMFYFGLIGVGYGWLIGQAIGIIWIFIHRQNFHEF